MKIIDEPTLDSFICKVRCEWCGQRADGGCDPHHLWSRGMGGGGRLDLRINLIGICRRCHIDVHAGKILRADLLAIVAARERLAQEEITARIWKLRRIKGIAIIRRNASAEETQEARDRLSELGAANPDGQQQGQGSTDGVPLPPAGPRAVNRLSVLAPDEAGEGWVSF